MSRQSLLLIALLVAVSACSKDTEQPPIGFEITPAVKSVAKSNNAFAFDLYQQVRSQDGNLFLSPASISTALAMTYAGAEGQTEQEMKDVLHFTMDEEQTHDGFNTLTKILSTDTKGYRLNLANRLWLQDGTVLRDSFLATTHYKYGAKPAFVDFVTEAEQARQQINDWVKEQTNGKISNLMPSGSIDGTIRLVLANAIYFKGDWSEPFETRLTKSMPFHLDAEESVEVPMMHQEERFRYGEQDGVQILELPYGRDEDVSMVLLLPALGHLSELEDKLTSPEMLEDWLSRAYEQDVKVYVPRFRLESQFSLAEALKSLGMTSVFSPGDADLSGISSQKSLFVAAVFHKAYIDVNEEGTEAAAATGIAAGGEAIQGPPEFRADRPFIFLIRDHRSGSILFLGRVMNPTD